MLKVFLGGTCGKSDWREKIIKMFNDKVDYFNPIVDSWNRQAQEREDLHKAQDDIVLFVITPETDNTYSISEITSLAATDTNRLILCVLSKVNCNKFDKHTLQVWRKIVKDLKRKYRISFYRNLKSVAKEINRRAIRKSCIEEALC